MDVVLPERVPATSSPGEVVSAPLVPSAPAIEAPPASDWTPYNSSGIEHRRVDDVEQFVVQPQGPEPSLRALLRSAPAWPYTVEVKVDFLTLGKSANMAGFGWRHTASGQSVGVFVQSHPDSEPRNLMRNMRLVRVGPKRGIRELDVCPLAGWNSFWLRFHDTGTDLLISASIDGIEWKTLFEEANPNFRPDQLGPMVITSKTPGIAMPASVKLSHWRTF